MLIESMREDAKKNGTKVQTNDEQALEQKIMSAFCLKRDPKKEIEFLSMLLGKENSKERVGLHASSLIERESSFCIRQHVLSLVYKQAQSELHSPSLLAIFEAGNAIHEKYQRLFLRAGFSRPDELDKTQYHEEYKIQFTPDIICEIDGMKMIGEIKSVNTFQFQKMSKHSTAGKQLQWYMYLTGIHRGFVLSEDKNTQSIKVELHVYDEKLVKLFIDRSKTIKSYYDTFINHKKLISRKQGCDDKDCKLCSKCVMRQTCWNLPGGRVKLNE